MGWAPRGVLRMQRARGKLRGRRLQAETRLHAARNATNTPPCVRTAPRGAQLLARALGESAWVCRRCTAQPVLRDGVTVCDGAASPHGCGEGDRREKRPIRAVHTTEKRYKRWAADP
jgi:hypothetical protein